MTPIWGVEKSRLPDNSAQGVIIQLWPSKGNYTIIIDINKVLSLLRMFLVKQTLGRQQLKNIFPPEKKCEKYKTP